VSSVHSLNQPPSEPENPTVFYRGHRLTALASNYGAFNCRVQAPAGAVLTIIPGCPTAGQALIQGQFWVMRRLGVSSVASPPWTESRHHQS